MNDVLAGMIGEQLQEQGKADADFRAQQAAVRNRSAGLYDDILSKMVRKPEPQYAPEILDIANALRAQPRLIPAVQKFLTDLVARVNAAVDAALMEPPK